MSSNTNTDIVIVQGEVVDITKKGRVPLAQLQLVLPIKGEIKQSLLLPQM